MAQGSQPTSRLVGLRRKLEVGDFVILFYIAAFVRQYLWPVNNNVLAWSITLVLTLLIWLWHLYTKNEEDRAPRVFWLVVGIPLLFFYVLRAALPDMSSDVLDYRLINGELGLAGWPIREGDFFPSRFPFNPAPDMVMGIARYLLGYRLGTVINLTVLIWTGTILEKIFRPWIKLVWPRCLAVLILLLTEHLLFEVNNYMVDLLALPLLLEASRLAFASPADHTPGSRNCVRIGLYLGAAIAFKLTNVAFAVPIIIMLAHRAWPSVLRDPRVWFYGLAALLLPLVPYTLFMYWQTGNPVFPLFNGVFKSPYWPVHDLRPERWGPVVDDAIFNKLQIWERIIWPILLPLKVPYTAGEVGPHWGRVTVGFLGSIAALVWRGSGVSIRALAFITLSGSLIWSLTSGMLRYAGYVEVAGGVIAIYLIVTMLGKARESLGRTPMLLRAAAMLVASALIMQSVSSCVYAFEFEWGGRPNIFRQPREHIYEAGFIFRDRSPQDFLSDEEASLFSEVDVWVESAPMTGGLQTLLRPDALLWCVYMDEFLRSQIARDQLARVRQESAGRRAYSLALNEWLPFAKDKLRRAGFHIGGVKTLSLPYYSDRARFHNLLLLELLPTGQQPAFDFDVTVAQRPLPDGAYSATLSWARPPLTKMRPGERQTVYIAVSNSSGIIWPALSQAGGRFHILAGNHWLDAEGQTIVNDDARTALPFDLVPGGQVELPLVVTAPRAKGEYTIEIDLLQENVAWFASKGSRTLRTLVVIGE